MSHAGSVQVTIYEIATGKIIKVIECVPEALAAQMSSGQAYILGQYLPHEFTIVNGEAISTGWRSEDLFPSTYVELRRNTYPSINDQLGALMKYFEDQRMNGQPLPIELIEILDRIQAVKDAYPRRV